MKIIVFDDDPTGSQTIHSCPLLLSWEEQVIRQGLRHKSPFLFFLANTRSLLPDKAERRTREICRELRKAIDAEGLNLKDLIFVSRGDSTLRGHGVLEPRVLDEELGPFAATFHIPAFLEGGRTTVNGMHLLNGVPVHQTPFAKDPLFGYSTSDLTKWLEEKSEGVIKQNTVKRISIAMLDNAIKSHSGLENLEGFLIGLDNNQKVIVDSEHHRQLNILGTLVRNLFHSKRFLFRSAASYLNSLADIGPQLLGKDDFFKLRNTQSNGTLLPGMVLVGSHVPLADLQLRFLLRNDNCEGVELPAKQVFTTYNRINSELLLKEIHSDLIIQLKSILKKGKTPVLFTSREEIYFSSLNDGLVFGNFLANFMSEVAGELVPDLGYIISKGGITTQAFLVNGLGLNSVYLEGQLLPGLSVIRRLDNVTSGNLPILTFPGNLGDESTLYQAWKIMESGSAS